MLCTIRGNPILRWSHHRSGLVWSISCSSSLLILRSYERLSSEQWKKKKAELHEGVITPCLFSGLVLNVNRILRWSHHRIGLLWFNRCSLLLLTLRSYEQISSE
jgi:hypothetical protein